MLVLKVNGPAAVTVRLSPPLSWRTRPVPVRRVTVPPMVYGPLVPPEGFAACGKPLQAVRQTNAKRSGTAKRVFLASFIAIIAPYCRVAPGCDGPVKSLASINLRESLKRLCRRGSTRREETAEARTTVRTVLA